MSRYSDETISTARLISFSDGVFAIAVTLLVFNLKVPQTPVTGAHLVLPALIRGMMPQFITYATTFLIIAVYWAFHHRMLNLVTRTDNAFLWMNICYLLTVSFMPFPSALFGAYPDETFSFIFYIGSMAAVGAFSMLMLWYAAANYRLISKDLPKAVVKYLFIRQSAPMVVFLFAIPLSLYQLTWARYYLFILFPIHWAIRKYFRKYAAK